MANVHYINCQSCGKQYYLDANLFEVVQNNPQQNLKCPFCKKDFKYEPSEKNKQ